MVSINKKAILFILTLFFAIGILGWMLWAVRDELVRSLQMMNPLYLIPITVIGIGSWYLRGGRYSYIIKKLNAIISVQYATSIIFIGQLVNIIVPARLGDFTRSFFLKKDKEIPYTTGFSSVLTERLFDVAAITLAAAVSLIFIQSELPEWMMQVILFAVVIGFFCLAVLYFSKFIGAKNHIILKILEMIQQIRSLSLSPIPILVIGFLSLIVWLCEVGMCFLVSLMFNSSVSFIFFVFAVTVANLSKTIPLTPGGLGIYEVIVAAVLVMGGVSPVTATLIAVIDHLIKNVIPIGGGIISVYYFGEKILSLLKTISLRKV